MRVFYLFSHLCHAFVFVCFLFFFGFLTFFLFLSFVPSFLLSFLFLPKTAKSSN